MDGTRLLNLKGFAYLPRAQPVELFNNNFGPWRNEKIVSILQHWLHNWLCCLLWSIRIEAQLESYRNIGLKNVLDQSLIHSLWSYWNLSSNLRGLKMMKEVTKHSMTKSNLKLPKKIKTKTTTTTAWKLITLSINVNKNWNPTFQIKIYLVKVNTSKFECCESVFENFTNWGLKGGI